jgi:Tol biopolymer transport system component
MAFTGTRNGHSDVYVIPAQDSKEIRLTTRARNDGPDFGPDGSIYFGSDRSGSMQIWYLKGDGTQPEQLTNDDADNWFPHASPDGKQLVYLSYPKELKVAQKIRMGAAPDGPGQPLRSRADSFARREWLVERVIRVGRQPPSGVHRI